MVESMHPRQSFPSAVSDLLREQAGVVTALQLESAGVSKAVRRRMITDGTLRRLGRGVFACGRVSLRGRAHAGLLVAARRDVAPAVGGWHALHLWGAVVDETRLKQPMQIWVDDLNSRINRCGWNYRRDGYQRLERARGFPRLISREDAVLDVCNGLREERCVGTLLDFLREGVARGTTLKALLADRLRHRHRNLIQDICSDAASGVDSALELRYRDCEALHGLPTPERQVFVGPGPVDVWFREFRLVIQLDGWAFHKDRIRKDARDDAIRAGMNIVTLRFGWEDIVSRPCQTMRMIADVLSTNGWTGSLTPCPMCP